MSVAQVALPVPLARTFDYLLPTGGVTPQVGTRVSVSFGNRKAIGIITALSDTSELPLEQLKPVHDVLDEQPLFPQSVAYFTVGRRVLSLPDW